MAMKIWRLLLHHWWWRSRLYMNSRSCRTSENSRTACFESTRFGVSEKQNNQRLAWQTTKMRWWWGIRQKPDNIGIWTFWIDVLRSIDGGFYLKNKLGEFFWCVINWSCSNCRTQINQIHTYPISSNSLMRKKMKGGNGIWWQIIACPHFETAIVVVKCDLGVSQFPRTVP